MEKLRAQEDLELPGEIETEVLEGGREGDRRPGLSHSGLSGGELRIINETSREVFAACKH